MSTLVAQTISNGTVSTSSANVIQGSAKAWVNYNGAAATIRSSYNVSSITVNASGRYTINMTNALADTNYSVVSSTSATSGSSFNDAVNLFSDGYTIVAPTTTAFRIQVLTAGFGGYTNPEYVCISVFR